MIELGACTLYIGNSGSLCGENILIVIASVSVFAIQGGLVLLAGLISPFMSMGAINEMTCAGSILIIMIGTNLMGIPKIKVADFLPAIIFAPTISHIKDTAVGLISIPDEKELLVLMDEIRNEKSA